MILGPFVDDTVTGCGAGCSLERFSVQSFDRGCAAAVKQTCRHITCGSETNKKTSAPHVQFFFC